MGLVPRVPMGSLKKISQLGPEVWPAIDAYIRITYMSTELYYMGLLFC